MGNISNEILFINSENNSVIVAFGGIKHGIGMPLFEFKRIISSYDNYNQYFFKDNSQSWYHNGIKGFASNIDDLTQSLSKLISNYDKVVFIGNSMGGYAAIHFGVLLNIDLVLAFSPQTFIDKFRRFYYKDNRWKKQIRNTQILKNKPKYFNLKKTLKSKNYQTEIKVFYSSLDKFDNIHVNRIRNYKNVKTFNYDLGGHNLVTILKENEILKQILNDNLL